MAETPPNFDDPRLKKHVDMWVDRAFKFGVVTNGLALGAIAAFQVRAIDIEKISPILKCAAYIHIAGLMCALAGIVSFMISALFWGQHARDEDRETNIMFRLGRYIDEGQILIYLPVIVSWVLLFIGLFKLTAIFNV